MNAAAPRFLAHMSVTPTDLNANGTMFGGALLHWVDHEAATYAILQLGNERVVTKYMSEINFLSTAWLGDLLELEMAATRFGRTALTLRCDVRNMVTRDVIITIERIVMVGLDDQGRPVVHGHTEPTAGLERVPTWHAGGRKALPPT
jgi:acyl-CoA hydrolase